MSHHVYDYEFTDRMEAGKQAAMDARNRGRSIGNKPIRQHKRPIEDTEINRVYAELASVRAELRQAKLDAIAPPNSVADFGAEFDKLAGRQDWRPADPITASPQHGREAPQGAHAMNTKQYLAALKKLRLKPASKQTAALLGIGLRHCQRIAAGETIVTPTLAKLIGQYLEHGLPDADA